MLRRSRMESFLGVPTPMHAPHQQGAEEEDADREKTDEWNAHRDESQHGEPSSHDPPGPDLPSPDRLVIHPSPLSRLVAG
ncbi:MAG TPA: hypothetical protein VF984_09710 [Actinomycetota bacterium]